MSQQAQQPRQKNEAPRWFLFLPAILLLALCAGVMTLVVQQLQLFPASPQALPAQTETAQAGAIATAIAQAPLATPAQVTVLPQKTVPVVPTLIPASLTSSPGKRAGATPPWSKGGGGPLIITPRPSGGNTGATVNSGVTAISPSRGNSTKQLPQTGVPPPYPLLITLAVLWLIVRYSPKVRRWWRRYLLAQGKQHGDK